MPRFAGLSKAKKLPLFGSWIEAEEGLRLQLLTKVIFSGFGRS